MIDGPGRACQEELGVRMGAGFMAEAVNVSGSLAAALSTPLIASRPHNS